jgi:hypothetical protein
MRMPIELPRSQPPYSRKWIGTTSGQVSSLDGPGWNQIARHYTISSQHMLRDQGRDRGCWQQIALGLMVFSGVLFECARGYTICVVLSARNVKGFWVSLFPYLHSLWSGDENSSIIRSEAHGGQRMRGPRRGSWLNW